MIYKIRIRKLRNNELLQFLNDVLSACSQQSTEPMKLAAVIAAMLTKTNTFDSLFKLTQASPITQELIELDFRRDNCLTGMHTVIDGYTYHYEPAIQKAANELILSMDKYGKPLAGLNYPAETSTIKSLVGDWTNIPALAGNVTLLALGNWVIELVKCNDLFNDKYMSRATDKATAPHVKTFDARMDAIESYKNLVTKIESGANFVGDNSFDGLINLINELVVKYNIIADSHTEKPKDPKDPKDPK